MSISIWFNLGIKTCKNYAEFWTFCTNISVTDKLNDSYDNGLELKSLQAVTENFSTASIKRSNFVLLKKFGPWYILFSKAVPFWSCPLSRSRGGTIPHLLCMPKWAQICGKMFSHVGLDPYALPTEPRLQMSSLVIYVIAECDRNAAMRLTANKNFALSASTITA